MDLKISDWVTIGAALLTVLPVCFGAFQYMAIKRAEEQARQFVTYHGVIQSLVETGTYIDRQIASVYELRSYPNYFPVTHRLLSRLKKMWGGSGERFSDLIREMEITLDFIEKSGKNYSD